jgi:hypothetical protein
MRKIALTLEDVTRAVEEKKGHLISSAFKKIGFVNTSDINPDSNRELVIVCNLALRKVVEDIGAYRFLKDGPMSVTSLVVSVFIDGLVSQNPKDAGMVNFTLSPEAQKMCHELLIDFLRGKVSQESIEFLSKHYGVE